MSDVKNLEAEMKKNVGVGKATHLLSKYLNPNKKKFEFQAFYIKNVKYCESREQYVYVSDFIHVTKNGGDYNISIEEYISSHFPLTNNGFYWKYDITQNDINVFKETFMPKLERHYIKTLL